MVDARRQPFNGQGLSALIVDDDAFSRKLTLTMLNKLGIDRTWEASSGEDGILAASTHRPDVILLDWTMPGMSGLQTLRQLKSARSPSRDIPVIVTSEHAGRDSIVRTAREGASAMLIKPFASTTLGARLVRALSLDGREPCSDQPARSTEHGQRRNCARSSSR